MSACGISKKVPDVERKSDTAVRIEKSDSSFAVVKDKGTVIVGVNPQSFPFCFVDRSGAVTGFDVDMATAAAQTMGVEIEFKKINADNLIDELNSEKVDLAWGGIFINSEFEGEVLYSKSYVSDWETFFTLRQSPIEKAKDLQGKIIAVENASNEYIDSITDNKNIKIYKSNSAAVSDLEKGKIDAVFQGYAEGKYHTKNNECIFKILNDTFYEKEYAAAVRFGDRALMSEIDNAIQNIIDNGAAKELSEKWFGDDITK